MIISNSLHDFYVSYYRWVIRGAPNLKPYGREAPLLWCVSKFGRTNYYSEESVKSLEQEFKNHVAFLCEHNPERAAVVLSAYTWDDYFGLPDIRWFVATAVHAEHAPAKESSPPEYTVTIKNFYDDYSTWLLMGAPNHQPFSRRAGLCNALHVWWERLQVRRPKHARLREYEAYNDALQDDLQKFRRNNPGMESRRCYPFGGELRFRRDSRESVAHKNEYRLKFITERLLERTEDPVSLDKPTSKEDEVKYTITDFYRHYHHWATTCGDDGHPYSTGCGLCRAVADWYRLMEEQNPHKLLSQGSYHRRLDRDLAEYVASHGGVTTYPFGGESRYDWDMADDTAHKNPLRLKFLKDRIG